jgi:hypothetical protein
VWEQHLIELSFKIDLATLILSAGMTSMKSGADVLMMIQL